MNQKSFSFEINYKFYLMTKSVLKTKVFDQKNIFNPKSPWISNTAVAQLLFKNDNKFQEHFPQYKILDNKLSEFFIFLNSGGVNSMFFHIKTKQFFFKST